jgi:hypothetical protein
MEMAKAKRRKYYGRTWLTKPRWFTKDRRKAEKSFFVWGHNSDYNCYSLSLLGVINGFLDRLGLVLAVETNSVTREIKRYFISKKWW